MAIIDCPRCNEGDERPEGQNRCGHCEYTFTVRDGKLVALPYGTLTKASHDMNAKTAFAPKSRWA
jgi:transposase-like protein